MLVSANPMDKSNHGKKIDLPGRAAIPAMEATGNGGASWGPFFQIDCMFRG
jgi:hypothetical protein